MTICYSKEVKTKPKMSVILICSQTATIDFTLELIITWVSDDVFFTIK
jgi:hypothetical protein